MKFIIFIFIIILIVIIYIYVNVYRDKIIILDLKYFAEKIINKILGKSIIPVNHINGVNGGINGVNGGTNKVNHINGGTNKILIITCDNRPDTEYIKLHNSSFESYTNRHPNIDYKFYTDCGKENIYWSRLFLIRNLMMQNKYKWIGWVDSDTIIIDNNFNLNELLNGVNGVNGVKNKDIIIADDNQLVTEGINSGIFFIKNSETGFNFILDVINQYKSNDKCREQDNKLNGMFAGVCYEQAQMELQIQTKYKDNTYIIPSNIVLCTRDDISGKVNAKTKRVNGVINKPFIYHLIATKTEKRNIIFKKLII